MFNRTDAMYEHANDLVKSSLQLRQELEANHTDQDHEECILLCKAIRQHVDALGGLIDHAALSNHDQPPAISPQASDLSPLKLIGGGV